MANKKRLICANTLREELSTLTMTVTGLRAGKGVLKEFMEQYRESVLRIVDEQATVDAVEVKANVGDFVYALWEAPVKLKYIIYCAEVKEIRISTRNCRLTTTYILEPIDYRGRRREYRGEDFGTLVFKEQQDAERKLYPCVHCMSGTYRSCEGCSYGERKDNG